MNILGRILSFVILGELILELWNRRGNKRYHIERRENTSAWELLLNSNGNQLRRIYGEGFFGRLEREMYDRVKNDLKNDE